MAFWKQLGFGLIVMLAFTATDRSFAQDIESLVMPGNVIEGHAEIESECSSCHKMFKKGQQSALCMDCHEDVAKDVNEKSGFHGLSADTRDAPCSSCHADHLGRDADIVPLDEATFDHDFTDFELVGAHLEAECEDCHAPATRHREAADGCIDCHQDDDVHNATLGEDCAACHVSTEWKEASFDHDSTGYPLLGKHMETGCLDCHVDATYKNAPTDCFGCHEDDDAHEGRSGNDCGNCHNPSDWHDSSFDHGRDTDFPLQGKHAQLTCGDCHSEDPFTDVMDSECVACHLEDDNHDGHNGTRCNDCHSNDNWTEPTFDHDRDTDYMLRGGHLEVACNDCHIEPIFEVPLMTNCDSCHLDDDPHEGSLGTSCQSCHTEVSWQDPVFFDHDLTAFPLLGKHRENECEGCHETQAFKDTDSACNACHADDDPHNGNFHERCGACHNPVGWEMWTFDHDLQTTFPLTGAHIEVACEDCHRSSLKKMQSVGSTCRSCHRADDVHDGEFGFDCGRCHSADSFKEVRSLQ